VIEEIGNDNEVVKEEEDEVIKLWKSC